jgi:outer membrane protein assembly factor BamB
VLTPNHAFVADTRGNYALLSVEAGTLLRPGRTFARISATPTATDVGILVASEDHTLYALHALTLHDRWKFRAPHALTLTPTILQDVVYLPVPNHGLIAIDANKGEKLWELRGVYAHPIHSAGHKVLMNAGKELILLNVNSGQTITRIATKPLKTVLRTPTGELILVGPDAWLVRLDRN